MEKHILLSIQPRIVEEIKNGSKKYEFRKKFPDLSKDNISNTVIIYCSSPVMKIIGSFKVAQYLNHDFETLMIKVNATNEYKERISRYLQDKSSCHAMEISQLKIYEEPLSLSYLRNNFPGFFPGQSYRYLEDQILKEIKIQNGSI